jgi:hypothetical protein
MAQTAPVNPRRAPLNAMTRSASKLTASYVADRAWGGPGRGVAAGCEGNGRRGDKFRAQRCVLAHFE